MSADIVGKAQEWIAQHQDEMIADLRELLQIPSLEADALPNAPFGEENRKALDLMLSKSEKAGMKTQDVEGYCGWAEYGAGKGMVMSLGHLDVVPVGPGWEHEPFGAEVEGEWIYARGAIDNKGPTVAAFNAARALQAVWPDMPARLRMVYGCNEESGFKCIERYVDTEEIPTYGVAPDAGWPLIHGEKGIADLVIDAPFPQEDVRLLEITGGQRPNIVIDECRARAWFSEAAHEHAKPLIKKMWDRNLTVEWKGEELHIHATGKAAHGSYPYGGDSAAIRVLRFLAEIAPLTVQSAYAELFDLCHIGGNGLGIAGADEPSGPLTCNLGIVETVGNAARMTFNIRYPVTWTGDELRAKAEKHLAKCKSDFRISDFTDSPPLYFPLDHPLVNTILEVCQLENVEKKEPGVMGGGTYARAIPNTVAIGTGWPGDGPAHETDERVSINHVIRMSKIYAHIFARLLTLAASETS